jgi:hypothetical protein
MPKQYSLVSSEPLTEFDEFVLRFLHDMANLNGKPKSVVGAVVTDADEVVTYYHNATMQDMMVAKGYLELDIQTDNILGNLPWFVEQARKEGLLEDECESEWDAFDYEEEDDEDGD